MTQFNYFDLMTEGQQGPIRTTQKNPSFTIRSGFTLIELLVTMSIILILLTLIISGLSTVKRKARAVDCINRIRQVSIAVNLYQTDNNDFLPHPNWDFKTNYAGWLCRPPFTLSAANLQSGLLWSYIGTPRVYLCPADNAKSTGFKRRKQRYTSYTMNGAVCEFLVTNKTLLASQVQPASIIIWEPNEKLKTAWDDGASWPYEGSSARHGKGSNTASVDGHVEFMSNLRFGKVEKLAPGPLWFNPDAVDGKQTAL
jgi:prepilin-type N-terminal cleavage/methylation domain-containing protein/prepilin-type processing-associated H-X9-DG protein